MAGGDRVELGEDGLLDGHLLRDRFDHEVDVTELVVRGGAGDQRHDFGEAGVSLLLGQLLLLDEAAELARRDVADLLDCVVYELLVNVLDYYGRV